MSETHKGLYTCLNAAFLNCYQTTNVWDFGRDASIRFPNNVGCLPRLSILPGYPASVRCPGSISGPSLINVCAIGLEKYLVSISVNAFILDEFLYFPTFMLTPAWFLFNESVRCIRCPFEFVSVALDYLWKCFNNFWHPCENLIKYYKSIPQRA